MFALFKVMWSEDIFVSYDWNHMIFKYWIPVCTDHIRLKKARRTFAWCLSVLPGLETCQERSDVIGGCQTTPYFNHFQMAKDVFFHIRKPQRLKCHPHTYSHTRFRVSLCEPLWIQLSFQFSCSQSIKSGPAAFLTCNARACKSP